jgi:RNA polymerase sigma-70 factor (ECF subfamily)
LEVQLIERLIEGICRGDEQVFRKLYDMYKDKVYNTARMITNDEKAAEDILQDVFVIIFTKIYKLKHPGAFEAWLYKTVINQCNSLFRKGKKLIAVEDMTIENAAGADRGETPSEQAIRQETNKELMKCINLLSEKLRICIILYYFNEMSIREIGETLECSEGTVKSRLFKAKKELEKSLNSKINCEVREYGYR